MSLYRRTARSQHDPIAFLKIVPLFVNLSQADLEEVTNRITRHTYDQGVMLFHQDTPGVMLYIIEEGVVRVFGVGLTGQEHTLNTFGPGEVFGELSIIDGKPRSASAVTMAPSTIWMLSKADLDELLERCFTFSQSLIRLLANRVRTAAGHVEAIIFQDVPGRLAYELLELADRHGKPVHEGVQIEIPLTQSDLATIVGATRESINKALGYFRARKLVQVDGVQITLLDSKGLRQVMYERGK
jgi:CRP/FNR family transcriptional regulator, cyclic AMP receptor protein